MPAERHRRKDRAMSRMIARSHPKVIESATPSRILLVASSRAHRHRAHRARKRAQRTMTATLDALHCLLTAPCLLQCHVPTHAQQIQCTHAQWLNTAAQLSLSTQAHHRHDRLRQRSVRAALALNLAPLVLHHAKPRPIRHSPSPPSLCLSSRLCPRAAQ